MKISSKVECGIISLVDICIYSNDNVVTVINISARQNISAKYLEQILPQLRQADIIRSVKGAKGGYTLTRPAEKITLKEVINALDSTVLGDVTFDGRDIRQSDLTEMFGEKDVFLSIFNRDIADRYDKLSSDTASAPMYYI